jgi:hypothetical protein
MSVACDRERDTVSGHLVGFGADAIKREWRQRRDSIDPDCARRSCGEERRRKETSTPPIRPDRTGKEPPEDARARNDDG